jgi:tRNA pseudouridine38-40 synthase
MRHNIKLLLAYEGTHYFGWQKTTTGSSIEEELEKALSQVLQEKIDLQAASRTDRGVHAEGQVVNFFTQKPEIDLYKLKRALNGLLPNDMSVLNIQHARDDFHPTLDCLGKEYHYQICSSVSQLPFYRHFSWHFPYDLDSDQMQRASDALIGEHDFSAFCNERQLLEKNPVRKIEKITITTKEAGRLLISVTGNHFLYKMVRNIVGTLVYVGCGKLKVDDVPLILQSKKRTEAGITAPAHGLSLKQVFYEF